MNFTGANFQFGLPYPVIDPSSLETLTMRPAADLRISGSMACATASAPTKLVCRVRPTASIFAPLGGPSPPRSAIPALLTRMSSLPNSFSIPARAASIVSRHVERNKHSLDSLFLEFRDSFLAQLGITRPDQHGAVLLAKLASYLKADALVGAGNQSNLVR